MDMWSKCRILCIAMLCMLLAVSNANALAIDNLYDVTLPVADRSSEQQKLMLGLAFEQLLIRLTGGREVLESQKIIAAKKQVDAYINSFTYVDVDDSNSGNNTNTSGSVNSKQNGVLATVKFNEQSVNSLLKGLKQQFLGKNRPLTIVWLLEVNAIDNSYDLISDGSSSEIGAGLDLAANQRKLPIVLPLLDLIDRDAITKEEVFNGNLDKLRVASQRYNAGLILLGKIIKNNPAVTTEWILIEDNIKWQTTAGDLTAQLDLAMDGLLKNLVYKYTGKLTAKINSKEAIKVQVNVAALDSMEDHLKVLNYLRGLPTVAKVEAMGIGQEQASFMLHINGEQQSVISAINADKVLERVVNTVANSIDAGNSMSQSNSLDAKDVGPEDVNNKSSMNTVNYRLHK